MIPQRCEKIDDIRYATTKNIIQFNNDIFYRREKRHRKINLIEFDFYVSARYSGIITKMHIFAVDVRRHIGFHAIFRFRIVLRFET